MGLINIVHTNTYYFLNLVMYSSQNDILIHMIKNTLNAYRKHID